MAVNSKHPKYNEHLPDWEEMRDTYTGERAVKAKNFVYLPATEGMKHDGLNTTQAKGFTSYQSYISRAHLPDLVKDAVEAMLGVMHNKPPVIELPSQMEPLREQATLMGESLEMLLRKINEEQLVTGRAGLLVDMPEAPRPDTLPYIAMYLAENIINWDAGRRDGIAVDNLNLVVLDESEHERQENFEWKKVQKYRVLVLGDPLENEPTGEGVYSVGVFRENNVSFNEDVLITPMIKGVELNKIPFTFVNSKDVIPDPDQPPLTGLARIVLAIYRGEADYRQSLFMQGQDTFVTIGGLAEQNDEPLRLGAGGRVDLPLGGDAKFVGVESGGLSEQREALSNDYKRAFQKGGQLMDSISRERESGDALKVRVAARTATLNQIAITGAFAMQEALRNIASWMGLDPKSVTVEPNLDFVDDNFKADELVKLITARNMGAPLSLETIHNYLRDKDITSADFEEEMNKVLEEDEEFNLGGSTNPEDLEEEPNSEQNNQPANQQN
jgi:hypothetical protein